MTRLKALRRQICAVSLALLAALAHGSDVTDFRDRLKSAQNKRQLASVLQNPTPELAADPILAEYFSVPLKAQIDEANYYERDALYTWKDLRDEIVYLIDGKLAAAGQPSVGKLTNPQAEAKKILSNPIYIDRGEAKERNWLGNVGDRIGERIAKWLENLFRPKNINAPNISLFSLEGMRYVFWGLIGLVIALVLFFVIRSVRFAKRKRRVGGMLEDDEPERSADEWLTMAEGLAGEQRYREAVRCLYLACLMKYDDATVAHFRRHETNWEHLYRIAASPRDPGLDFRSLTQRFDKVWYGNIVKGVEDYGVFRTYYESLLAAIKVKVPA